MIIVKAHRIGLKKMFSSIKGDEDNVFFKPHEFTDEEADSICEDIFDDYYLIMKDYTPIAYGMLRGWRHFKNPSLGIYVAKEFRGFGIGKMFMHFMHCSAKLKGAEKVLLSVNVKNESAIKLYESLGYVKYNSMNDKLHYSLSFENLPI
jgi:ribosomal protein S18 acetylase RimI-like enzyme